MFRVRSGRCMFFAICNYASPGLRLERASRNRHHSLKLIAKFIRIVDSH
jgi:hypothetical protein